MRTHDDPGSDAPALAPTVGGVATGVAARRPSIVITYPFPLGDRSAGGSRTTPTIARHLGRLGCDVHLLAVSTNPLSRRFPRAAPDPRQLGEHLDAELATDGVRIVRVPQSPLHFQLDGRGVRRALERILRHGPVDWVLAHYHEGAFLPRLCARRGIRFGYLATWQTYSHLRFRVTNRHELLRSWAYRRFIVAPHRAAEVVFAISRFTAGELVEYAGVDPARIVTCPLGVAPAFLEVPRPRPAAIRDLVYFGRIVPSKGFDDALRALAELHRRGRRDWTFRMFGEGRQDLARALARELGIAERVEIAGPLHDEALRAELGRAQLALLPSHFESFGLSIAEAQGAGLPVVAYARGSVPEVVADGETGWLAPFREPLALADRLEAALADPEGTWRVGLAARERARRCFSWERAAEIVLEGFRALGPRPQSSPPA